ncbi:MAG: S8 family serine peptidase, partial [bacterium]
MTAQLKTKNILTILIISFLIFIVAQAELIVPNDGFGWKTADWDEEHPGGANWAWEFVKLPSAWNYTTGNKNVKIGIVDTSFDSLHEDLRENIFLPFITIPWDEHGTAVAGIVGAKGNNDKGITGVMWDTTLLPYGAGVPVIGGTSYALAIMNMWLAIIRDGAKVINYSAGSDFTDLQKVESENKAWKWFLLDRFKNIVFVFAAGEENVDDEYSSPSSIASEAGYDHVISVTASDRSGDLNQAAQANYGDIVVAAPGDEIMATVPIGSDADDDFCFGSNAVDGYGCLAGTSFSAPFVSGLAGLIYSVDPTKYEGKYKGKVLTA